MCDFRGFPTEIIDLRTNDRFPAVDCGHLGWFDDPHNQVGVYLVGCTGCAYSYWDGQEWWHPQTYSREYIMDQGPEYERYDFVWPEKVEGWGDWIVNDITWCGGMEIKHLSYKFPLEGNFTESIYSDGCCRVYDPKSLPANDLV